MLHKCSFIKSLISTVFEFIIKQLLATVMKEQCETSSDWNNTSERNRKFSSKKPDPVS